MRIKTSGLQPNQLPAVVNKALAKGLDDLIPELDTQFTREIQSTKWGWPNITQRKNGREANYVRDIVDMGDLMRSQQNQRKSQFSVTWSWEVNYSAVVHNGANLKGGGVYLDRPWTTTAANIINPEKSISDTLRRELNG